MSVCGHRCACMKYDSCAHLFYMECPECGLRGEAYRTYAAAHTMWRALTQLSSVYH